MLSPCSPVGLIGGQTYEAPGRFGASYVCMLCESDVCSSRFDPLQVAFVYTDLPISRG
jgi:hypothetical protein